MQTVCLQTPALPLLRGVTGDKLFSVGLNLFVYKIMAVMLAVCHSLLKRIM